MPIGGVLSHSIVLMPCVTKCLQAKEERQTGHSYVLNLSSKPSPNLCKYVSIFKICLHFQNVLSFSTCFFHFQNLLSFSKCAFIFKICFHFQNVFSYSKLSVLMYILCLQLMVVSSSMSLMLLLESIRSQQTSHRDSSSANCSSTMKLFSE